MEDSRAERAAAVLRAERLKGAGSRWTVKVEEKVGVRMELVAKDGDLDP